MLLKEGRDIAPFHVAVPFGKRRTHWQINRMMENERRGSTSQSYRDDRAMSFSWYMHLKETGKFERTFSAAVPCRRPKFAVRYFLFDDQSA
jgi:hypothetical protein